MINLRNLGDPEFRAGAIAKCATVEQLDELEAKAESRRALTAKVDDLRAECNTLSKAIGRATPEERPAKLEAANDLKQRLKSEEAVLADLEAEVRSLALEVPNPAHPSVPTGDEASFDLVATVGDQPEAPAMDHADFGAAMGWVDLEKGAEVSGSRFAYLKREAVLLEFALVQWTMQKLVARGFIPTVPPVLVREQMMVDAGFFPTDEAQVYEVGEDELYLVGTSEVPLAGIHTEATASTLPTSRFATPGSRAALDAKPELMARTLEASSECISSTRSRCSSGATRRSRGKNMSLYSRSNAKFSTTSNSRTE